MEKIQNDVRQYCGFKVAGEEYAIPVMEVQEVIKPQVVTSIPLAQNEIRGLINLRGQIVTCLSLRQLFKQDDDLSRDYMNIIVKGNDGLFSLVVDEVTDIINVEEGYLENAPDTINPNLKRYVEKIYKKDRGLVILLNIARLIDIQSEHNK
ncbi:MAG: purine-binding chemotaxis protein CheW [Halobacteriovoraceae bacterium]|jgi:purine-binding chemotaxis protein CheW|nr:purine-binding chemotaxis protein CheW [Halobacteriovoraceae bacterium]